ncbi:MAG: ParB/RepB/Spo0J family partition protein [Vulcanibacillus sp.]
MSKRLGKGLDALIPTMEIDENEKILEVDVARIRPNPYQPRKKFNEEQLSELMESIKEHGVIQPIIVRQSFNGYEIVAGERRWRATRALEIERIPVVVRKFTDQQVMEIALIENLQREDLNSVEIAYAYKKLITSYNLTQEELAERVGVSRPNVANYLRLLQLPEEILDEVSSERISTGHARALITIQDKDKQLYFTKTTISEKWSVRQLEEKIKQLKDKVPRETKIQKQKIDSKYKIVEEQLRDKFRTAVKIIDGKNKGKIEIEFFNSSDLERIIDLFDIK